ncbi:trigger factor [Roseiarcus sp.]|uniref:trigger factor n=1 Tax=Roseiarcus sp. TaxID=1969460 RepID=UPI003C44B85A
MQVTETLSQGLKREYDISLPASDLAAKLNGQLAELKSKVRINGFRPGKVPVEHLRKVYGKSVMADVVQEAIASANKKIVDDNGLRLAREPKIELPTDQAAIDAALEARGDLNFKVALEVLPVFEVGDFSQVALERLVADVEDADVDASIDRLAEERRTYTAKPEGAKAELHDRVTVDFSGTIKGVPFEGGEGKDIEVVLGSNSFIPGFEEQLLGVAAGDRRTIQATFPEAYAVRALAGQTGDFDVTVKAVAAREAFAIDDEFAKGLGFEGLDNLKAMIRDRIAADYARASRDKVKRQLLDKLDTQYGFELPEGLVNQEFDSIWTQVTREQQASGRSFADENTTEDAVRADYRKIAERRVRLGLLLAEVGNRADVKVSDEEMTQALVARARSYPGQEKQVWDFYRNNQQALAELRAPIYEEKVVDHIIGRARVAERKTPKEELLKPIDDEMPGLAQEIEQPAG